MPITRSGTPPSKFSENRLLVATEKKKKECEPNCSVTKGDVSGRMIS